jgi:hypothetical protein
MGTQKIISVSLVLLAFLAPMKLHSQPLSSAEVEQKTLAYYESASWDLLILTGEEAIGNGIDYYWLRMRTGIARYEKKQFGKATGHFRKALEFNGGDKLASEYLFYSLRFGGKESEALRLAGTFPESLQEKIGFRKRQWLESVYSEGGIKLSSRSDSVGNMGYFHFGLRHRPAPGFSFYHAYTGLTQTNYWGDYLQHQYFLTGELALPQGFSLHASLHYLFLHANISDTVRRPGNGFVQSSYHSTLDEFGQVYYLDVQKSWGCFSISPFFTWSRFRGFTEYEVRGRNTMDNSPWVMRGDTTIFQTQWQAGLEADWTPRFLNKRLSLTTTLFNHHAEVSGDQLIFKQAVVIRPASWVWVKGEYYRGEARYVNEGRAMVVNNSFDPTLSRWSGMAVFSAGEHWEFYLLYQQEKKRESQFGFPYKFNTVITGIKFSL